jgi:hypothetical protein
MSNISIQEHTKRETVDLELYDNKKYKLVAHNTNSEWVAEVAEGGDVVRVDHKKRTEENDDIDDIFTITGTRVVRLKPNYNSKF